MTPEPHFFIEQPGEFEPPPPVRGQVVYHHTTSGPLPIILREGELCPVDQWKNGAGTIWATSNPASDRISRHLQDFRTAFRAGQALAVRFTCNAEDFRDGWRNVYAGQPRELAEIERLAIEHKQPTEEWRWRGEPLPIDETLIETRTFNTPWRPLTTFSVFELPFERAWAVRIGERVYMTSLEDDTMVCEAVPYSDMERQMARFRLGRDLGHADHRARVGATGQPRLCSCDKCLAAFGRIAPPELPQ